MPVSTDMIMSTAMRKSNTCKFYVTVLARHTFITFVSLQNGFIHSFYPDMGICREPERVHRGRELGNQAGKLVIGEVVESLCSNMP